MKNPLLVYALFIGTLIAPAVGRAEDALLLPSQSVVLFGDSITATGDYGQIMQDMMDRLHPNRRVRFLARGSHGDTAQGAHRRVEEDVLAWRPAWVILNFGINDAGRYTPEQFMAHYESLLDLIEQSCDARIVIASPLYPDTAQENPRLTTYTAGLRELAARRNLGYAPVYETMRERRADLPPGVLYAPDTVHPNQIGNWMIAQTMLTALQVKLPRVPMRITVPARRTNREQKDASAKQEVAIRLPMPLQVTLDAPPLPVALASPALQPVQLDGRLNEWNRRSPVDLNSRDQRVWGIIPARESHLKAQASFMYHSEALYFAIEVQDSLLKNPAAPRNIVSRDCIELCLDGRAPELRAQQPAVSLTPQTRYVFQYVLAAAGDEAKEPLAMMGNGDRTMLEGVQIASAQTPVGYTIELRIPKERFAPGALLPGSEIGLDFAVVDVDRQANYLSATELRWTGSPWSAFSTREFGALRMSRE